MRAIICLLAILSSHAACGAEKKQQNAQAHGPKRGLKQNFGQFSPLLNNVNSYGGWGGSWVLTPPSPPLFGSPQPPAQPQTSPQAGQQSSPVRPTVVWSVRNGRPSNGVAPSTSSSRSSSGLSRSTGSSGPVSGTGTRELGKFTDVLMKSTPNKGVIINPGTSTSTGTAGRVYTGQSGNPASSPPAAAADGSGRQQLDFNIPNLNLGNAAGAQEVETSMALARSAGIINGVGQPRLSDPAVIADLPRFDARDGRFTAGTAVEFWPSINPSSRINAVFLEPNATKNMPPPDNVTVLDPAPISVTRLPAASFESGYCVPRVAYLVTNVTALACVAGSNLTRWDNEPVCAKLDCSWRGPGTTTNVANTATGCRTVVERPKPICPNGCVVLEQWRWNTTVNRTQLFTKCSCKAGNQPCPSLWTACTCYEGLNSQNLTRGFVVCSETQGECDRKCNLAVSGNPRLAPLCPIAMDPFLSINPTSPPIYPSFGWNIASQAANQAATLGNAGRSLKQWVSSIGRRLTMAAEPQLHKVSPAPFLADGARGSNAGAASVDRSQQQQQPRQQPLEHPLLG